jgi:predicted secreted protein
MMTKRTVLVITLLLGILAGLVMVNPTTVYASNVKQVDESSSGEFVLLDVGDTLKVVLDSNTGSTGYSWNLVRNSGPDVLQYVNRVYEPPVSQPGQTGASGHDIWSFSGLQNGLSIIKLDYKAPWSLAARSFNLVVYVGIAPPVPALSALNNWLMAGVMAVLIAAVLTFRLRRRHAYR